MFKNKFGQVSLEWVALLILSAAALLAVRGYAVAHVQESTRKSLQQFSKDLYEDGVGSWNYTTNNGEITTTAPGIGMEHLDFD